MWWTIGAVVLGGILIAGAVLLLNTTLLPNIKTKVNDLDRSAVTIPNSNLLDGTKDFSGNWDRAIGWENDGTYNGLTVKKKKLVNGTVLIKHLLCLKTVNTRSRLILKAQAMLIL